jgi:hypothetical protein
MLAAYVSTTCKKADCKQITDTGYTHKNNLSSVQMFGMDCTAAQLWLQCIMKLYICCLII